MGLRSRERVTRPKASVRGASRPEVSKGVDPACQPVLGQLLEHAPDAAFIIDAQGLIRFGNAALERLSGHKLGDLVGRSLGLLLPEPVAAQQGGDLAAYCLGTDLTVAPGWMREAVLRDHAGHLIPIGFKAVELTADTPGGERLVGAFMTDLRPRKLLEAENTTLRTRLEVEALSDPLTGLPNRRAFDAEAVRTMARAQRDGTQTLFALLDIDDFKDVNERHGQAVGDAVLKKLSHSVQSSMRATDLLARFGGDSFGWLLPRITVEQAEPAVERIRAVVAAAETMASNGTGIAMTVSAGLALLDPGQPLNASLERAETALRRAKAQGTSRVVVY